MSFDPDVVSAVVSVALVIVALIALYFAHKTFKATAATADATYETVKATQKSIEADLLYALLKDFSTKEMLQSLRTLYEFEENNRDIANAYKKQYSHGNKIDLARRDVSHYYQRISQLKKAGYVTELFVKTVCSPNTPKLLRMIVIPIEIAHAEMDNEPYHGEVLEYLLEIIDPKGNQ